MKSFFAFAEKLKEINIPMADDLGFRIDKLAEELLEYAAHPSHSTEGQKEFRDVLVVTALLCNVRGVENSNSGKARNVFECGALIQKTRGAFREKRFSLAGYWSILDGLIADMVISVCSTNYDFKEFYRLAVDKVAGEFGER